MPEFQGTSWLLLGYTKCTDTLLGGSFDPWGGPGYDACSVLTGPDFQDVFYKQNWASNVKLVSYYMFYGYVIRFEFAVFSILTVQYWY